MSGEDSELDGGARDDGDGGRGDLDDLLDAYVGGTIEEEALRRLESVLRSDPAARARFVQYCRMDTDLHLHARARRAGDRALEAIGVLPAAPSGRRRGWLLALAAAATFAGAVLATWLLARSLGPGSIDDRRVAWLVNAQNCRWGEPSVLGDLGPGRALELSSGLAELRFSSGATLVLQGPARLVVVSAASVRLERGRLSARVPEEARGFQVLSPAGRVVDLGTEFGISVDEDGLAEVRVFSGQVAAYAGREGGVPVDLGAPDRATISGAAVEVETGVPEDGAGGFVRAIEAPPTIVPRTVVLDFRRPVAGSILDAAGAGTGLTHRLPGTGGALEARDAHLVLDPAAGCLRLTTTNSDINTQYLLDRGEYLGLRLADLGFTGGEDFEITMLVSDIPALQAIGQFGLYVGPRSDRVIRGGLISREEPDRYGQFLVNNDGGRDSDLNVVGLLSSGETLRVTLSRIDNRYSLTVANRWTGATSTLTIRHPEFLDAEKDLHVGIFGANTQSQVAKTLTIREVYVTVRTKVRETP